MTARLLLIEDDESVSSAVQRGLAVEGFEVDVVHNGDDGLAAALAGGYSLLIVDILLPGLNGYQLCESIRRFDAETPILVLTAKDGDYDEIEALDLGADDYLRKPFSLAVLAARIRALQRRPHGSRTSSLRADGIVLDPQARSVNRDGVEIELTPKEFMLLTALLRNKGQVMSKEQLLEAVWGIRGHTTGLVHVYVGYLRDKIDRPFGTETIRTVRGFGYVVDDWEPTR